MHTEDPKVASIISKVQKLLAIARDERGNEHQAEAAAAKAQELLDAYNLDMVLVGQMTGKDGAREDRRLSGGLYKWQRYLWRQIASQNYCHYWADRGLQKGSKYEHRIVGRVANVLSTKLMAEYLQQAVEQITREEYCAGDHRLYFKKDAIAFREGMADRICERLRHRQWQKEVEARREQERRQASGESVALTILDVRTREREANDDFLYGEGYTARRKLADAQWEQDREERRRRAEEAAERFMREHPEEYARQQAEAERERKREERNARRRKGRTYREPKPRHESFYDGQYRGNTVGLDPQVRDGKPFKRIGG